MTLSLDMPFDGVNFISFWLYIDDASNMDSNTFHFSIFEIQNSQKICILQLLFDSNDNKLKIRQDQTIISELSTINYNTWNHIFLSFSFNELIDRTLFSLIINDQNALVNAIIENSIPTSAKSSQIIYFGALSLPCFNGNITDIIVGKGGHISYISNRQDSSNCLLQIGIQTPQCILCADQYYLSQGKCYTSCSIGYYSDINQKICRNCHQSCQKCVDPSPDQCLSCSENYPQFFDGYCLNQCPFGTNLSIGNNCECDFSCSKCKYDSDSIIGQTICIQCAQESYFISGYKCVPAEFCSFNQFGYIDSGSCVDECPEPMYSNYVNRLCETFCSKGSIIFNDTCIQECPPTYFTSLILSDPIHTNQTCLQCVDPCLNCISEQNCTSCKGDLLIHESIGICKEICEPGFIQDGIVCRICFQNCIICPVNFYLYEGACYQKCPLGYIISKNICISNPTPIVIITNKTQEEYIKNQKLSIGRRKDVYIEGQYFFNDEIQSIIWSLRGNTTGSPMSFFENVYKFSTDLQIPYKNLQSNMLYELQITVTAKSGQQSSDYIVIQTSLEINQGIFDVQPRSGISGMTEFTLSYMNWTTSNKEIYIDTFYFQTLNFQFRGETVIQKKNLRMILQANQEYQKIIKFKFSPQRKEQILTVQIVAYNQDEESYKNIDIFLNAYNGNQLNLISDVWWVKLQSGLVLSQYLDRTYEIVYLYQENQTQSIIRLNQENILLQQQNFRFSNTSCAYDVQCSKKGTCEANYYDNGTFQCKCFDDFYGDHCRYSERELQVLNNITYSILYNIRQIQISDVSIFQVSQILNNLAQINDGLHKKSFRLYHGIAQQITTLDIQNQEVFNIMFDSISNLLFQTGYRPSLRPDEKMKYISIFKNILYQLIQKLHSRLIFLNQDFIFTNQYITIYLTKKKGTQYLDSNINQFGYVIFPLDKSITMVPSKCFENDEIIYLRLIQYNFDHFFPASEIMTSQIQINFYNQNFEELNFEAVLRNNPLNIYLMKLGGYIPLPSYLNTYYKCQFVQNTWIDDALCNYTGENEYYIKLNSYHVGQFVVVRGLMEYIQGQPSIEDLQYYNMKLLNYQLKYFNSSTYDFDYWIKYALNDYRKMQFPVSIQKFFWQNPCIFVYSVAFVLYIVISLLNFIRLKKNVVQLYDERFRHILILSFHPYFSVLLIGETPYCYTFQMRITKFFQLVLGNISITACIYQQIGWIDYRLNDGDGKKIIISALLSIFINNSLCYLFEVIFHIVKTHLLKNEKAENPYIIIIFIGIILSAIYGIDSNGRIREDDQGQYVSAFISSLMIDFLMDLCITFYAFCVLETPFLHFCAFKGFFIRLQPDIMYVQLTALREQDSQSNGGIELDEIEKFKQNNKLFIQENQVLEHKGSLALVNIDSLNNIEKRKKIN